MRIMKVNTVRYSEMVTIYFLM